MATGKINPDLIKERNRCTFTPEELTHLLDGGPNKTQERKAREKFFLSDPDLKYTTPPEYLSHKEKYEEAMKKACILFRKVQQLQEEGKGGMETFRIADASKLTDQQKVAFYKRYAKRHREVLGGQLSTAILSDGNPLALHYVMFIPTLMGQGTPEQQAEWIQKAWACDIIGTYAQTELGHGTFIRGLETIATYDSKTEEFVLHSPTITAYKWWPGGLAHTANYAVVVAQLYTKGACYGIHPFIVQLRDEETHRPLKGIKIGEIGCKLGMNATNNGYLGFENVRIPRKHMLMKNSKVLKDGTYVSSPNSKLTYGTMMFVRVVIVQDAANYLRKAITIAVRYSAVRHQSQIKPDEPEPQIIDYVTQQYKLFPLIATYFAYHFTANWLWDMYNNISSELEAGQLERLPELHALSCSLKAVSSADCAAGVELCRLSCGGHGYMTASNLPTTYGLVTAMCTYEGENTVMLLQTARFLVKAHQSVTAGKTLTPTVQYLSDVRNMKPKKFEKTFLDIISVFEQMAAAKLDLACKHMTDRIRRGAAYEDAWNDTSIELVGAAEAHCRAVTLQIYHQVMSEVLITVSHPLRRVLIQLIDLYATYTALRCTGDLLRFSNITSSDIEDIQIWMEELLALIRPNAVGIVDGFDICDESLNSALGAYDGNVYERLFEAAQNSPLNAQPVNKSFNLYLKPFLKSKI